MLWKRGLPCPFRPIRDPRAGVCNGQSGAFSGGDFSRFWRSWGTSPPPPLRGRRVGGRRPADTGKPLASFGRAILVVLVLLILFLVVYAVYVKRHPPAVVGHGDYLFCFWNTE